MKVGSTVKLNSNGPLMTICSIKSVDAEDPLEKAMCWWYEPSMLLYKTEIFPLDALNEIIFQLETEETDDAVM